MTRTSELQQLIGQEVGVSRWFEVSQARIDAFADLVKTETRPLVLRFLEEASGRLTAAAPPALTQRSSGSAP